MAETFCNNCGHRNPVESSFCSSCGAPLELSADSTITLTAVDPLQEAPGEDGEIVVTVGDLPPDSAVLIVRSGAQTGDRFALRNGSVTRLGRHPDSEIMLDDITVSRRHVSVEHTQEGWVATDAGSLNGTYVNQERIDRAVLHHGDELQVGKFRLVLFERGDG